jgi:hypothetical protein
LVLLLQHAPGHQIHFQFCIHLVFWKPFVHNIVLGRYARVAARAVGLCACVWYCIVWIYRKPLNRPRWYSMASIYTVVWYYTLTYTCTIEWSVVL